MQQNRSLQRLLEIIIQKENGGNLVFFGEKKIIKSFKIHNNIVLFEPFFFFQNF